MTIWTTDRWWATERRWDEGLFAAYDRIVPPTEEPLSLEDVRDGALRGSFGENDVQDRYIERLIKTARLAAERLTRRSLMTQTWQLSLSGFPSAEIRLKYPPVQAVESISYRDDNGTLQTFDADSYDLLATGRDENQTGVIELATSASWPSTTSRRGAVLITYRCGYVDSSSPPLPDVPEDILVGMEQLIASWWENREAVVVGVGVAAVEVPRSAKDLLERYKVFG